ncbi:PEGA domain-containing protein [Pendulispora albinea]|uniref:PEGA domain-containing protein n=1 Tax=Pendulispora albinea TaxID=2741071 RepID=A0ABZ2LM41_9BACT
MRNLSFAASSRVVVAAFLTLGFSAFSSATAFAQNPNPSAADKEAARKHYEHCLELFNSEAYDSALVECEKAYQLAPSYKILYNVGLIDRELNDFTQALKNFERYIAEGGADVPDARRTEVDRYITQLKGLVANLEVKVNVPGADVTIDDVPVGKTPFNRVRVNPGRRKVTASREGYAPVSKVVNISVGENADVELALTNLNAAKDGSVPLAPEPESNPWATRAWIGWGATAAFAIGAGITGFMALDKSNKLSEARKLPNNESDLESKSKDVKTFSITSDVLLGAAIVGAGISTWFTVRAINWKPEDEKGEKKDGPSVSFGVSPFGVVTHGRF